MAQGTATIEHSINNIGPDACFIRMETAPYEFIYITATDGDLIHYLSRKGYEGAMIMRDKKAAKRFINEQQLIGYKPVLCKEIIPNDGSLN